MGERFLRTSAATQAKKEVLRVKRIQVEGLFGLYNHDIPLNSEERVTILHGPNGVGKTVLLKMIAAVFDGNYRHLNKTRFTRFAIDFSNDTSLVFEFLVSNELEDKTLRVALAADERTLQYTDFSDPDDIIKGDNYRRRQASKPNRRGAKQTSELPPNVEPQWLEDVRQRVVVHLIETDRLIITEFPDPNDGTPVFIPTVREIATNLRERIANELSRFALESQAIEQSFPQRLLQANEQTGVDATELAARIKSLNAARAHLEEIGLLDAAAANPFEYGTHAAPDPIQRKVIPLYVEDNQRKLALLDDIAHRITLFLDYINGKFRNKSIQISRENGFVVMGHDEQPIKPDALSSGEQHELVQLYDLLFRVKPGTLVLIDEPELSLHIRWQKRYLPELLEMVKLSEFDAIIATHSNFIVGDRSDLMVPLAADIDT
jgi:predicted ATP-dependent endonuclease of OLD family